MSVYKKHGLWVFDFQFQGERHTPPKGLETKSDAEEAEAHLKRLLRRRAAGLEALAPEDTPTFTDWAAVTWEYQRDRKQLKRPEEAKKTLRMFLAFWGAKPRKDPVEGGEYRDLRLGDPIANPSLIEAFEAWMTARHLSGSRKNHYRSAGSMMYRVALLPGNRQRSGVRENPFQHVLRDRPIRRTAVPELDDILRWLNTAPLPVVVGASLALLSPALRLRNVVDLRRANISRDLAILTVPHKADRETGMPLTVAISPGLRRVLKAVYRQRPDDPYVVPLDGERYWQFLKLVKRSLTAADLPYGRTSPDGLTFHSLRHAVSTWLARWKRSTGERQKAMGHQTSAMADWYAHLSGVDTDEIMRMIDAKLPVAKLSVRRIRAATPTQVPPRQQNGRDVV